MRSIRIARPTSSSKSCQRSGSDVDVARDGCQAHTAMSSRQAGLVGEEPGDVGGMVDGVVGVARLWSVALEQHDVRLPGAAVALAGADGVAYELVAVAGGPAWVGSDGGS